MIYLPFVGALVAGITHILFPAQWRSAYADFSTMSFMRNFWRNQSDIVIRVVGVFVILAAFFIL